jgi:hypothetical protein
MMNEDIRLEMPVSVKLLYFGRLGNKRLAGLRIAVRESSIEVSGRAGLQPLMGFLGSEWYCRADATSMQIITVRDDAWIMIDSDEGGGVHLAVRPDGDMNSLWLALAMAGVHASGMPPSS